VLEAVQVEEEEGSLPPVAQDRLLEEGLHVLVEQVAVAQARELVVEGEVPEPPLHGLALADIPDDAGEGAAREVPGVAEGHLHGGHAAVLGHAEYLDRPLHPVREPIRVVDDEVLHELVAVHGEDLLREEHREFPFEHLVAIEAERVLHSGIGEDDGEVDVEASLRTATSLRSLPAQMGESWHSALRTDPFLFLARNSK
jgi:hypothetical protein